MMKFAQAFFEDRKLFSLYQGDAGTDPLCPGTARYGQGYCTDAIIDQFM